MILEVVGQRSVAFEAFAQLGVRDVARHHHRAGQHHARFHRVPRKFLANLGHRAVQVDAYDVGTEVVEVDVGQEARGVGLELFEKHSVARDLAERLTVGAARHRHGHGATRAVTRQTNHPHVVAEVLAAELGADARLLGELQDFGFEVEVAEAMAGLAAVCRQRIEVSSARQLRDFYRVLGRRSADHDGEVVRRARGGAERLHLLEQPGQQRLFVEQRLGFLEKVALVRRAAALGDEQELVFVAVDRRNLDLGRQVGVGVRLFVH